MAQGLVKQSFEQATDASTSVIRSNVQGRNHQKHKESAADANQKTTIKQTLRQATLVAVEDGCNNY
ncbi:MAG: hypothetical protein AAGC93_03320 [Cyanobacteria bacterium P01_F01_bin.53]